MKNRETAVGTAVMAALAIGALAVAWVGPWFEYDFTTGRQTPPGGAYNGGEDGVERDHLTFWADRWTGDVAPADMGQADRLVQVVPIGIAAAVGALALAALGEVPGIHRLINRRVALVFLTLAIAAVAAVAVVSWLWLPETMADHQVDSQYAAALDEDVGYSESNLMWGWYAVALAFLPAAGAWLFKFQAGTVDPRVIEELLRKEGEAA